ncbi:MAG TPA: CcmD family protein [Polyangiaceae bacterium]|nr:CcmD family protein [Polyangiaceae bacterium]
MMASQDSPGDRATSFQAVQGGQTEHYSGEALLVTAYAIVWVVVLGWVALMWRKQSALLARVADLQREIDKAGKDKA